MGETASPELLLRRLDSLQNNVSGVNRRLVTLESNLANRGWKVAPRNLLIALGLLRLA